VGTQKTNAGKQHFWLAATTVVCTPDGQTSAHAPLNVTIFNKDKTVGVAKIQEIQQRAQREFFQKVAPAGENPQILDVFIQSISYLGRMTMEEFQALPEGVTGVKEEPVSKSPPQERKSSVPEGLK
tara:strand:+ start:262 stop:639 length:378 start_codon:yes stop_codon:yes gene_type:complete